MSWAIDKSVPNQNVEVLRQQGHHIYSATTAKKMCTLDRQHAVQYVRYLNFFFCWKSFFQVGRKVLDETPANARKSLRSHRQEMG
jgi:tRNA/tmRNA/rRNA uracil-C5-methylase (TrmA/RlmC/RlmD family)